MDVVVDGVSYVPAAESTPRIGVAITTHNRPEFFRESLEAQRKHLPPGARLVVVDDASSRPVAEADYRFSKNAGIARAKNKCLELLDDCEHIFLFDDDAYPVTDDWWRPYVESPEPHLMWLAAYAKIGEDSTHVAHTDPQGHMLYVDRLTLLTVGGLDPNFKVWGSEHIDWSNRIHAHGLTTWRYADVKGSNDLFHSIDRSNGTVKSSVPERSRREHAAHNRERCEAQRNSAVRYPYREQRDVIVTHMLTKQNDHQNKQGWKPDPSLIKNLAASAKRHELVVLCDEEVTPANGDRAKYTQIDSSGLSPYLQRWVASWRWLRDNPDVRFVWFTDGWDVELLNDPFPHMVPGSIYLGSETSIVGKRWLRDNHKTPFLQEFMDAHHDRQLLNAGLVGGDRHTVLEFLHHMVRLIWDAQSEKVKSPRHPGLGLGDMATFNYVGYTFFPDRMVIGPRVNTVYKAEEKNEWSWWKHK